MTVTISLTTQCGDPIREETFELPGEYQTIPIENDYIQIISAEPTGCQAFAALCDKLFAGVTDYVCPVVYLGIGSVWIAAITINKISVRGEGPTMDAACQNAVNKYEQAIR